MSQLYSNAVDTELAAPLSDSGVTATLVDGSGLNSPTGGDFELLVLEAGSTIEVVRITARTGNEITITRAQEGTTAQPWSTGARAFSGVTAGTLGSLVANQTEQANSLALGGASVTVQSSVSIGPSAQAINGNDSVSVGNTARAWAGNTVAVGRSALAQGLNASAFSAFSAAYGANDLAVGANAIANNGGSVAVGEYAYAGGNRSICIGADTYADGQQSVAIGADAYASSDHALIIAALPCISLYPFTAEDSAWGNAGVPAIITSDSLNMKNTQTYSIPLPTGVRFFPDEVGVIILAASGVTGQPTVRFGIDGEGNEEQYLDAVATTGLTAAWHRQRFETLKAASGATTLRFEVTAGATGTTLSARIYWRGIAIEVA